MAPRVVVAAVSLALMLAACDGGPTPAARRSGPSPAVSPSAEVRRTTVRTPKIDNRATGRAAARVALAIRDLRRTRFWRPLTRRIYVVSVGSRPGRQYVPDDGHLAEARAFPFLDDDGGGRLCDITFFPTAISDDMKLQARYFEQGLLERGPPSRRHFWAAILGHELAHCLPRRERGMPAMSPEPVAQRWEDKVLAALERDRT